MTSTRQPRTQPEPPEAPSGTVVLEAPPAAQSSDGVSGLLANLVPMLGSVGSIVFVAMSQPGPRGLVAGGMFLLASLGFVGVNGWRQRQQVRAAAGGARRRYLAHLSDQRATVRRAATAQRRAEEWSAPDPHALAAVAEDRTRVWERDPEHVEFLQVRIGIGERPLCLDLETAPRPALERADPVAASAAHRFLGTHRVQRGLPATVDLRSAPRIAIAGRSAVAGRADATRALARAVVAQLATFHAPQHLRVVVLARQGALLEWDWVKWLPHAHSPRAQDAVGAARMIGTALADVHDLLPDDLGEPEGSDGPASPPHVLLVLDGGHVPIDSPLLTAPGMPGVTVLDLDGGVAVPGGADGVRDGGPEVPSDGVPVSGGVRLLLGYATATGDRTRESDRARVPVEVLRPDEEPVWIEGDQLSVAEAEAIARRLLPLDVEGGPGDGAADASAELVDLLGIGDVRDVDPDVAWRGRAPRDRLRVPIGRTPEGDPVVLDLKEAADRGMGPHGLIVGATGSGKSEVLRTLVLGLALTHSSADLNLVLVDFKGGATFAGMADLPHVSATITNLGAELALVDRMRDALHGETVRRQELLRSAGNLTSVAEYEALRSSGRDDLAPLPALLIVCDEFSELLSARPEMVDLFVSIGRLGRSLRMHLLLASQRLEEGRLRGLDSHLSYRIGLRTFSAAESRAVLGVPDAHTLPPVPGAGYLRPDPATLTEFRAAYVSGPPPNPHGSPRARAGPARLEWFTAAPVHRPVTPTLVEPSPARVRSTFEIAVSRLRGRGPAAHRVWLPPLVVPPTMDEVMPDLVVDPRLGLVSPGWRGGDPLTVPIGTVDRPLEQRREHLTVSLAGAGGHLAVVGAPRTGKSTVLRSVVVALSLTRTPLEVQFYVLDLGGGTFAPLSRLAHVAGVATRAEPDAVRRVVAEVESIVDARERYFRREGIDSIETYRTRRARGTASDGRGDVFLVVDGWSALRGEFEALEPRIQSLAGRGPAFGVHLVAAAARWLDFRTQIRDLFDTRLELRPGDPADSDIDRRAAAAIPRDRPGRGLAPSGHHVLTALPRVDGDPSVDTLGAGVAHLVEAVNSAWPGPAAPKLRLLPAEIPLDRVRRDPRADLGRLLLGVDEAGLAPVGLDPRAEPHLYAFGDAGSGKTALLRTVAAEVRRLHTPERAQFFVLDPRRSLLGEIPDAYLGAHVTTAEQAAAEIADLAEYLHTRLPGRGVTPDELRARSWWAGADVYLLVDDYDLVTAGTNPLAPLLPLLSRAGDVGLFLVLARRSGGAGRAMYEPVLQSLRDLAAPGLLLSGSPEEGALVGTARPAPGLPGRAQFVTRAKGRRVVQLAWTPPAR